MQKILKRWQDSLFTLSPVSFVTHSQSSFIFPVFVKWARFWVVFEDIYQYLPLNPPSFPPTVHHCKILVSQKFDPVYPNVGRDLVPIHLWAYHGYKTSSLTLDHLYTQSKLNSLLFEHLLPNIIRLSIKKTEY